MSTDSQTVRVHLGGDYVAEASTRAHRWHADMPAEDGGTDTGPTPEELLLGALGACTAMTLRMYAARKGWALEAVDVELWHQRIRRSECVDCADAGPAPALDGYVDRIERRVIVHGPLDADQQARLLEIAEKCPVHRILTQHPRVVTTLAAG
jgi:putative redox protein